MEKRHFQESWTGVFGAFFFPQGMSAHTCQLASWGTLMAVNGLEPITARRRSRDTSFAKGDVTSRLFCVIYWEKASLSGQHPAEPN